MLKTNGGVGYFPGPAKPIIADTAVLALDLSDRLRALVEQSSFFRLDNVIGAHARGAANVQTLTLTIEDSARVHQVAAVETGIPAPLRALVDFVRAHGSPA